MRLRRTSQGPSWDEPIHDLFLQKGEWWRTTWVVDLYDDGGFSPLLRTRKFRTESRMSLSHGGCWLAIAEHCATMSRVMKFMPPTNPLHGFRVSMTRRKP